MKNFAVQQKSAECSKLTECNKLTICNNKGIQYVNEMP